MRITLAFSLFLFGVLFTCSSYAQDKIYYKNGTSVEAKILEISGTEIVFKKATNPDGPTYHEQKSAVSKIEYSNGTVDRFESPVVSPAKTNTATTAPEEEKKNTSTAVTDFKNNYLTYNITDALFKRITVGYERIVARGFLGVKVPLSFGLGSNKVFDVDYLNNYQNNSTSNQYYYSNNVPNDEVRYTSILRKNTYGLEINAYPFGQHAVSFFVGPAFYYGQLRIKYEETKYYPGTANYSYGVNYTSKISYHETNCISYSGMINTGFVFASNSDFSMNMQIGIGFRQNKTDFDDYTATIISPSFHIGYKF